MEPIDVGIYSLLPPLIAITLALITKEVISSLMLGILSGGVIYCAFTGAGFMDMVAFPSSVSLPKRAAPKRMEPGPRKKSAANGPQNLPPVFSVCSSSSMTISTASQSERL